MFILHLALRKYSPPVSNVAPLGHLTLISSKPVCVLTPQCCVTSRKAANATFIVCNDGLDRGANPRPTALEASMKTITPSSRSFSIRIVPVRLRWEFQILVCQNRPRVLLYVLITMCHKHVKEWKASLQNFYDRHQELFTVTKYPFLKWQWIFSLLRIFFPFLYHRQEYYCPWQYK